MLGSAGWRPWGGAVLRKILGVVLAVLSVSSCDKSSSTFVFAKIIDPVMPEEREQKYENPLGETLRAAGLGDVTGGGTMLAPDKSIVYVGLDIELSDLQRGLPLVRKELIRLGAPRGSTLEYDAQGESINVPLYFGKD